MADTGQAFFVHHPASIDSLRRPHLIEQEQKYSVAKTIKLSKIDFENFITDMLVSRSFLEENGRFCKEGEILSCLLIHNHNCTDAVLVIPENEGHVKYAAYIELPVM